MKLSVSKRVLLTVIWSVTLFILVLIWVGATGKTKFLVILPCILFFLEIIYCVSDFSRNIYLFCFLLCFFTFLLGGQIINTIMQVYGYNFSEEIEMHTNIVLTLSLIGLILGYFITDRIGRHKKSTYYSINYQDIYYLNIRFLSKKIFFITYFLWVVILLDNVIYVLQSGYLSYYLSYHSRIPAIIRQVGYMAPMALFVFLATMPEKKEAKKPIIMYIAYLILSLGTGRRVYFMTGLLIVFAYMMMRNVINPEEEPWIAKKDIIKIILLIPILLVVMYFFEYIRADAYVGESSNYSPIIGFFVRQGTSINVIKYGELFKGRLNPEAHYSFYNIIKWLQGSGEFFNKLFSLNFNFEIGRQSAETAMEGTYLADFISYNANKSSYLMGMGYGSCYIEELFIDFGYIGVFLGNFLYGIMLCALLKNALGSRNVWKIALGFYITDLLIKAPRATFDAFIGQSLYLECWGTVLIIYLVSYLYKKRKI